MSESLTRRSAARGRLTPVVPWPAAGSLEEHIRAERVRVIIEQAPPAQLLSIVAAAAVCWVIWDVGNQAHIRWWFITITVLTVARMSLALAFRRARPLPIGMHNWELAFISTLAVVSLAWGVGGMLVMPESSLLHQAVVYFFLMGIAGGAVASYAAHAVAAVTAVCALMLPATIGFALHDAAPLRVMALGGVLYVAAAIRSTRSYGFFLRRTFQLSYELHEAYGRAQNQARTDELTGLANRRAFVEIGTTALEQARRYNRPLALVMLDIDHFKKINDTYGHAAGDQVLRAVAASVKQAMRTSDLAGRLGGEEFAVLLPETTAEESLTFAERLRKDIAGLAVPHGDAIIRLTCSFGVAERDDLTALLDQLLGAADAALYQAKDQGRDRVVLATASTARPS